MAIEFEPNPAVNPELLRAEHFKMIIPLLNGVKIITVNEQEYFFAAVLLADFLEQYKTYWNRLHIVYPLEWHKPSLTWELFGLKQEIILNWFAYYNRNQAGLRIAENDLTDPETWRIVKNWAQRLYQPKIKKADALAASILGIPVRSYQIWAKSEEYFQNSG